MIPLGYQVLSAVGLAELLRKPTPDHADAIADMGLELLEAAAHWNA